MTVASGDAVFPIPSPDFLMIHQATVKKYSTTPTDVNDDGQRVDDSQPTINVMGYFTAPNPNKIYPVMESVDAVFLCPLGTDVEHQDEIIVPAQASIRPRFVGQYAISSVKENLSHMRVLLYRIDDPDVDPS